MLQTPGNADEKATPYSKRGIDMEARVKEYAERLTIDGEYISDTSGAFENQDHAILTTETGVEYADGIIPERSEELRITFLREHDTFPEVELVVYQYDSAQCLVTLNGESTVLVSRSDVVDLAEEVTQMILSE